jgi:hypothetical protein
VKHNNKDIFDIIFHVTGGGFGFRARYFVGKIGTWENDHIHKDIGTIEILRKAQLDRCEPPPRFMVSRFRKAPYSWFTVIT